MKGCFPKSPSNGYGQREVAFALNPKNEMQNLSKARNVNKRKLVDSVFLFVVSAACM